MADNIKVHIPAPVPLVTEMTGFLNKVWLAHPHTDGMQVIGIGDPKFPIPDEMIIADTALRRECEEIFARHGIPFYSGDDRVLTISHHMTPEAN